MKMQISLPATPPASSASVRASMQGNRPEKTSPETKLRSELERAGICNFLTNYKELPGSPDIVFPDRKLAVFLHGCFWHRCPYCDPHFPDSNREYWAAKFSRNRLRDKRVKKAVRQKGWTLITIWECKLKKSPKKVMLRIKKSLEKTNGDT